MNKLTTQLLRLGAVMLLFTAFSAGNAWAQANYASPTGKDYVADGDCGDPLDPCNLAGAVTDATDGGGNANPEDVVALLPQSGGTVNFSGVESDLVGSARVNEPIILDTYTLPGPVTGVPGIIEIAGDVVIGQDDSIDIRPNAQLDYVGQPGRIEMRQNASIIGSGGFLVFSANTGSHFIQLGDPSAGCPGASPKVGTIENLRVDKIGGTVTVRDQCAIDDESDLFITNKLEVLNGALDMLDNNLHMVGPTNDNGIAGGVEIGAGAVISGDGTFFISVDPAALGGPPNNFTDCYLITGDGNLNMAFDKDTDAGVCIDLNEIGSGGISFNHAGNLYVREASVHNGTFQNDSDVFGARTEFWALGEITSNLEVNGPGKETFPADGDCGTGAGFTDNESGVYFFSAVEIGEQLITTNTDDPSTVDCVEGVWFMGDADPDVQGVPANAAKAATDDPNPFSTVVETFTSDGVVGIYLGCFNFFHNVAYQGNFAFDESPIFTLCDPADAFPIGDLCSDYDQFSRGNKVLFTGGNNQDLLYNTLLDIQSVQINKDSASDVVEIDEASPAFLIDTSLEVIRGRFTTNGLLDANSGGTRGEGATVVINRDASGDDGILDSGNSSRAYLSDAVDATPRKVKYTGSTPHFTGDEILGPASGEVGLGTRLELDELEIFMSDPNAVITLGKDFTIVSQVTLTQGILDVGSSKLRLDNELLAAIGNGEASKPEQIGARGEFLFPSQHVVGFTAGDDGIDLLYFGTTDRTVGLFWPPAETDVAPRKTSEVDTRNVAINPTCGDEIIVSLRDDDIRSRINGDLIIGGAPGTMQDEAGAEETGALDINGQRLEINAVSDNDTVVDVHNDADLCDSENDVSCAQSGATARVNELAEEVSVAFADFRRTGSDEAKAALQVSIAALEAEKANVAKSADSHTGVLAFIGTDDTDVWIETSTGRLRFDFPAIEVDRGNDSHVTFDAEGVLSTTTGDVPANNADVLGTASFDFKDADLGDDDLTFGDAGGVAMLDGLDILDVGGSYRQYDGEFLMAGVSSIGPAPTKEFNQTVRVGFTREPGDMVINNGEFFTSGGDVDVFGDFLLGEADAVDPGDALFSLDFNGEHSVVGDFRVGPNTDDCSEDEVESGTDACSTGVGGPERRNRYFLGGECAVLDADGRDKGGLFANGDYYFAGTGDRFDDQDFLPQQQGLRGNVFFVGAIVQTVWMRQDEDAFFCDVVMASRSNDNDGILLQSNGWQNEDGTLTLEHGIIDTADEAFDWIILNPGIETDLAKRNNSARGEGVVDLGSRDSYINGEVDRRVEFGNASGGVVTGGYLFPVGAAGEERDDGPVGTRDVDFFRPLLLQFPDDLGRSSLSRVDYRQDLLMEDCEFPEEGLVVDAGQGETLTLDVIGPQFWQLEFDRIPAFDPNVRVEADDLANLFDLKAIRLIQWDCDCTNPRLAGVYDTEIEGGIDDGSFFVNDYINGVPNFTQEGVNVEGCNIIGIASNFVINPINLPPITGGIARVQWIQNVPDLAEVDVYVDNNLYKNDFAFQTATPFLMLQGGPHKIDIVAATDLDNSSPIVTQNVTVVNGVAYNFILHGLDNPTGSQPAFDKIVVVDNVRLESDDPSVMQFYFAHGAPDLGPIDIRLLDPVNNNAVIGLLANNIDFDDIGSYISLAPAGYNIEFTDGANTQQIDVFRFELQSRQEEAFVMALTGRGQKATTGGRGQDLTIMGVEIDGDQFFPDLITADEEVAELPTEFKLNGNYPNPFNPSTRIQFDLPETAEVSIEIIDMLGRSVMTLPAKQLEAGAARTVEVNASNLASGTYLYRLIAKTATDTMVKTGRMLLIK